MGNLYLSIKRDKFEDESLKKEVSTVGKDLTLHMLCKLLNDTGDKIMFYDATRCRRAIYAHHAESAYNIRKTQLRAAHDNARR